MAGEIVKLRDQIEELRRGRNGQPDGQTSEMSQGICYNPNNPYALQRKIGKGGADFVKTYIINPGCLLKFLKEKLFLFFLIILFMVNIFLPLIH